MSLSNYKLHQLLITNYTPTTSYTPTTIIKIYKGCKCEEFASLLQSFSRDANSSRLHPVGGVRLQEFLCIKSIDEN